MHGLELHPQLLMVTRIMYGIHVHALAPTQRIVQGTSCSKAISIRLSGSPEQATLFDVPEQRMQNAEWDLNLEQHIIQLLRWIARHGTSMHQIGYAAIKIN